MRLRLTAIACFAPALFSGGWLLAAPGPSPVLASPPAPPISGVVSHLERPIAGALVVLYNLADASLSRAHTASDGTFVMASAPAGVYDVVAYKKGFVPALVRLWHQALPETVSAVRIQLAARGQSGSSGDAAASVWEMRDRLPADVLREINLEEIGDLQTRKTPPRLDGSFAGEVRTIADVSSGDTSLSRTAVGVHGGLPNGWKYDLRGDYAAVSDSAGAPADLSTATGNAAGLALDVATSPFESVRVSTRRHTLNFRDERGATLQAHGVSWNRGGEEGSVQSVAARYVEETNLYRATSGGTSFFPIASRTWEVKGRYARPADDSPGVAVAMTYRHREGTVGPSGVGTDGTFLMSAPDGDLSAATSIKLSSRAEVEGGVIGRYLAGGYGIAPRAGFRYDLGSKTYAFVRGLYRVVESGTGRATVLPLVASIEENGEATSSRGFTIGLERSGADAGFRVEASDSRVQEALRAFFEGDFLTDFDSIYLFDGNTVRQYQATGRRRLTETVEGNVSLRYGSIRGGPVSESTAAYGIGDNRGRFWSARAAVEVVPTRTGFAVVVRGVRQHMGSPTVQRANDSNKIAVSVAQDLSVLGVTPFGSICKLLVALESARSTARYDREEPVATNRLMGGVAISF